MMFIIKNIDVIIGIIALMVAVGFSIYKFALLGKDKQMDKIKEWLLFAVIQAEKELGGGTGQVKLRYVYSMFIDKFTFVQLLITFEEFSKMVDDALDVMRKMLIDNKDVKELVEGNQ